MAKKSSRKPEAVKRRTDKGALEGFEEVGAPRKPGQPPALVTGKSGYSRLIGNKAKGTKR